mgnify:CR=1 FL=1
MSLIWIVNILSVFFLCVFFAGIVIPQILLIAFRRRLFDEPDERKIHQCVVPRLGGMAFKPVVFFSFVLLLAVNVSTGHDELLKEIGAEALPLAYAFCAIIMLYLVGIADDLIGVRYRAKFFIQIVCGIMLVAGGVELSDLHGMLFIHSMPSWISIPLTVFVTVFIINAINLIDGLLPSLMPGNKGQKRKLPFRNLSQCVQRCGLPDQMREYLIFYLLTLFLMFRYTDSGPS